MLIMFNKPYGVLCQFTDAEGRANLSDYIDQPGVYAAGRLDQDSEGLLLLTDNGKLKHQLAHPSQKTWKTYLAQVEGVPQATQLKKLASGIQLKDGLVRETRVQLLGGKPGFIWKREPPIRSRKHQPTHWLRISVCEGRNRMIRRMTAAVGLPTLRLIRSEIGKYQLNSLKPGHSKTVD